MPFFLMSGDEVFLGKWVWVIFFEWVSSDRFPFWGMPGLRIAIRVSRRFWGDRGLNASV